MKTPNEFLAAIRRREAIEWDSFLRVMGRHGVSPITICRFFEQDSVYALKTPVRILDEEACVALEENFPMQVTVSDRVSAAVAGNSHDVGVDGNILIVHQAHWLKPQVAISWDGKDWSPRPDNLLHLLIVENLQNFLCFQDTLRLVTELCDLPLPLESILLVYGAGNAAAKSCNALYYKEFSSVNCLFDLDRGGIRTYAALKQLLKDSDIKPRFLFPGDVRQRLSRSRWRLDDDEKKYIHQARTKHPELIPLLDQMYKFGKKLEQETYLDD